MQFGIQTPTEGTTFGVLLDIWRAADDIDVYSSAWVNDHFLTHLGDKADPCLESWVTLTALAHATKRLRLGSLVNAMIYRHPAVLAKMAATLDIVSNGRLELSLGTGWSADDCTTYGIDLMSLGQRFDRFEEGCQVVISLLTEKRSNFEGQYYQLVDAPCEPKPIQRPHLPIVIGGAGPKRTLRAVARFADHWNYPYAMGAADPRGIRGDSKVWLDDWRRLRDLLAGYCAEVGRDPSTITTSVCLGPRWEEPKALAEDAAMWRQAGVDMGYFQILQPGRCSPDDLAAAAAAVDALTPDAGTRWQ